MQFFTPAREHFFRPLTHDNDPGQAGCDHADQYLMPLLRQHGRFLDLYQCNLRFVVLAADGRRVELTPAELGDGALRLLHLSPLLYGQSAATDEPPVYFIDELERSLQPALVSALLQTHLRLTRASLPKTQLIAVVRSVHAPELPALSACQKWQLQRPSKSAGAQLTRLLDEAVSVENRGADITGLLAD